MAAARLDIVDRKAAHRTFADAGTVKQDVGCVTFAVSMWGFEPLNLATCQRDLGVLPRTNHESGSCVRDGARLVKDDPRTFRLGTRWPELMRV